MHVELRTFKLGGVEPEPLTAILKANMISPVKRLTILYFQNFKETPARLRPLSKLPEHCASVFFSQPLC